jgi:uncharacterized protein DUF4326
MPVRIQRSRKKGWSMPANAIYVGRPTRWGNPYPVEMFGRDEAIRRFRLLFDQHRQGKPTEFSLPRVEELRGKDLVCWCKLDEACHADVLLEIANE